MGFEWDELMEMLVSNNRDVREILEALDGDWNVAEELYTINKDSVTEVVFDNMTTEEIVEKTIKLDCVEEILDYIKVNYGDEFQKFVGEEQQ